MWIAPYPRDLVPEGVDHSEFGVECPALPISSLTAPRTLTSTLFDFSAQHCPASAAFSRDGSSLPQPPNFLAECNATFSAGFTAPIRLTNFVADHASVVEHDGAHALIEESTWHSEIFYSKWIRVDRTTQWKWRIKPEWTVDLVVPRPVNHCYHRFHFQYFHWLFDVLPRIWLLKTCSPYMDADKWLVGPLNQPFHAPSLALFDIQPSQCIWPQSNPPGAGANAGCVVQYENAVRPEFTFSEPLKTRPAYNNGVHHKGWSRPYVLDIRDRAYRRYGIPAGLASGLVYVHRKPTGHRALRNEEAVLATMTALGFQIVDPGALPFEEQVRVFANARVVVGVHGAGMSNILWCKTGSTVLELLPEKLDDIGYRFLSNLIGHHHGVLMCEQFDHPQGIAYGDINVDINGLGRALKNMSQI